MDLYSVDIPFVDVPDNDRIAFVLLVVFLLWTLLVMTARRMLDNERAHASALRRQHGNWYIRFFAPFIVMAKLFSGTPENTRNNPRRPDQLFNS